MRNIYLTDSDEAAIVDFVEDHEELYDKTHEKFKEKARKDCFWEQYASNHNLSVKVRKALFGSERTHYGKLTQSQVCPGAQGNDRQNWIQDKFFEDSHQPEGPQQIFCI